MYGGGGSAGGSNVSDKHCRLDVTLPELSHTIGQLSASRAVGVDARSSIEGTVTLPPTNQRQILSDVTPDARNGYSRSKARKSAQFRFRFLGIMFRILFKFGYQ